MKLATTICAVLLASALGGCATMTAEDARNMTGFPLDQSCADFYARSPIYGGNRALAYATNCTSFGM